AADRLAAVGASVDGAVLNLSKTVGAARYRYDSSTEPSRRRRGRSSRARADAHHVGPASEHGPDGEPETDPADSSAPIEVEPVTPSDEVDELAETRDGDLAESGSSGRLPGLQDGRP